MSVNYPFPKICYLIHNFPAKTRQPIKVTIWRSHVTILLVEPKHYDPVLSTIILLVQLSWAADGQDGNALKSKKLVQVFFSRLSPPMSWKTRYNFDYRLLSFSLKNSLDISSWCSISRHPQFKWLTNQMFQWACLALILTCITTTPRWHASQSGYVMVSTQTGRDSVD